MSKSMSRHYVNNTLYQTKIPLSNCLHGANKMCPPETLHVLDASITMYMQELLQNRTSAGQSREDLNVQHGRIFYHIFAIIVKEICQGAQLAAV